jgi:hypothetical protein
VFIVPSAPVAHGSLLPVIERVSPYMLKVMTKMQVEGIRSICPSSRAVSQFNIHRESQLATTAWSSSCSSWFKNGKVDGPIIAIHPGSRLHFFDMIERPRYEDMDIDYEGNK